MGMALRERLKTHRRTVVAVLVLLIVATPFLLLHLLVLCARISEPKLTGSTVSTIQFPGGHSLRVYRRDKPNSKATLVFIHGSPATAHAFHAQFNDSLGDASLL